jgi:hypothetical protein
MRRYAVGDVRRLGQSKSYVIEFYMLQKRGDTVESVKITNGVGPTLIVDDQKI